MPSTVKHHLCRDGIANTQVTIPIYYLEILGFVKQNDKRNSFREQDIILQSGEPTLLKSSEELIYAEANEKLKI